MLTAFGAFALIGDFAPPTPSFEWDSLSYHLADPKLYIQAGRIYYIPWESHSNFAFTAEMWYMLALLFHSVPLAKLFHFSCAAGTCLAIYAFAARHLTPRIGVWAALLCASTPLVFFEAGTAYVDLAPTFFTTLTLLAVANGIAERDEKWVWVGAVLMGLTLSTKATSLATLALLAAGLFYWRWRVLRQGTRQVVGRVALWCVVALVIGSPWYIKSWVYTGNPVYPFFYHIFGGRGFSAANAADYNASNAAFGMGRRLVDALLVPWNLTMYLLPGHPTTYPHPFNDQQVPTGALNPLFLAALFVPAFVRGKTPPVVRALGLFALLSLAFWFVTMQYNRYLLPLVPVLCLLSVWALDRALSAKALCGYALACLFGLSVAFSLYLGVSLAAQQSAVVSGQETREAYIARNYQGYRAMEAINRLPGAVKLVFYGHPFGLYCDKPYFWGDANHSTVINYEAIHSPDDLRRVLRAMGVTHLLIDTKYFPLGPGYVQQIYGLAAQCGQPVVQDRGVVVFALPSG